MHSSPKLREQFGTWPAFEKISTLTISSRFSSPSQFSMEIAARFLEDQEFVSKFLQKSHESLRDSRVFVEQLLKQEGFEYHDQG